MSVHGLCVCPQPPMNGGLSVSVAVLSHGAPPFSGRIGCPCCFYMCITYPRWILMVMSLVPNSAAICVVSKKVSETGAVSPRRYRAGG